MEHEIAYLKERLAELEIAADRLTKITTASDSTFFKDAFLQKNLQKVLTEIAAVRKLLAHYQQQQTYREVFNVWRAN